MPSHRVWLPQQCDVYDLNVLDEYLSSMDVPFSIVTGLGLRLVLDSLNEPLGLLNPVLLGLCEGAAVHHFSASTSHYSSSDHYLAYALRVALDLYVTSDTQRTLIVVLWTTLGFLVSETLSPSMTRHSHRRRSSRSSVPAHIRHYQPAITPEPLPIKPRDTPQTKAHQVPAHNSTPALRPSRPPTPPSFFLEGESDATISPRQPHYLPSAFGPPSETDSLLDSPPPKPVLLPTPPSTLIISSGLDARESFIDERRLSTIEEQSSGEEKSQRGADARFLNVPGGYRGFMQPSYAPSVATTAPPLPIPNSTTHYQHTSVARASPVAQLEEVEDVLAASTSAAPLPVPNAGSMYLHANLASRSSTPSDDGDPLQTPQATGRLDLLDNDDGLATPPTLAKELSPLVLEQTLIPSFGQVMAGEIPAAQPAPEVLAANMDTKITTTTTTVTATDVHPPVEYPSPPVVPDEQQEDSSNSDSAVFKPESESGPESSHPTLIASPSSPDGNGKQALQPPAEQQQQQQQQQQPDLHEADQETETEVSAPSVISSGPEKVLYAKAEALRTQARAAEAEKSRLTDLLIKAVSKAQVKDVLFLKEEIRLEDAKATKLHDRAARRFYKARNASRKPSTVDVHGLRLTEAIDKTEQTLRDAFTHNHPHIRVIVGKGLHSANRFPVLKAGITKAMQAQKIPCTVDPQNTGVLILTLPTS